VALWAYLALPVAWWITGLAALGGVLVCLWRARAGAGACHGQGWACAGPPLWVLVLGGEGRWFYAPPD
jgi:uncharacterized SAM-binding protein YcdF (DUF218 family)